VKGLRRSSKRVKPVSAVAHPRSESLPTSPNAGGNGTAHCRICNYSPRGSIYAKSLKEQVINHIRQKHPESMLDLFSEMDVLFGQEKGDDSRCLIHGKAQFPEVASEAKP
jgi:hypothetical protein